MLSEGVRHFLLMESRPGAYKARYPELTKGELSTGQSGEEGVPNRAGSVSQLVRSRGLDAE